MKLGHRLGNDERQAIVSWLRENELNLRGLECPVRVAHGEINRAIRRGDVAVTSVISFGQFARVYLFLRTQGFLREWPLQRGRSDNPSQLLFPFVFGHATRGGAVHA